MVFYRSDKDHHGIILKSINNLRHQKRLCDVLIKVGKQDIHAHQCVLAAGSDYFMSILFGQVGDDEVPFVDLSFVTINAEVMESIINYLYSGEMDISTENLEQIIKVASFLLISDVRDLCRRFMLDTIDSNTGLEYYLVAIEHLFPDVEIKANKIVKSAFHNCLICNESTRKLSPEELQLVIRKCDIFENCSFRNILKYVGDWVQHGATEAHKSVGCDIIKYICAKAQQAGKNDTLSVKSLGDLIFQCQIKTCDLPFEKKLEVIWNFLDSQNLLSKTGTLQADIDDTSLWSLHQIRTESNAYLHDKSFDNAVPFLKGKRSKSDLQDNFDVVSLGNKIEKVKKGSCYICSSCGNDVNGQRSKVRDQETQTDSRPFECTVCEKKFKTKGDLRTHLFVHSEDKAHSCPLCQKRYHRKQELKSHMLVHNEKKQHKCGVCGEAFKHKCNLTTHVKKHSNEEMKSCETALDNITDMEKSEDFGKETETLSNSTKNFDNYDEQISQENRKPFQTLSTDTFQTNVDEYVSMKTEAPENFSDTEVDSEKTENWSPADTTHHLSDETKHECSICGKHIVHKENMKRHMQTHSTDRPHKCMVCSKSFKLKETLKQHMVTHAEKSESCFICQKRFHRKSDLTTHMTVHTGEKNHVCTVCNKAFSQKAHLTVHIKLLHSEEKREPKEKQHSCSLCQKQFCHKRGLKLHMLIHTGEKPYSCGICGKTFRHKNNLTQHKKKHPIVNTKCKNRFVVTGKMTHLAKTDYIIESMATQNLAEETTLNIIEGTKIECNICGKKLMHKVNMKRHLQTHCTDRPHTCTVCKKTFKFKEGLAQHMPVHSGEKTNPCSICHKLFLRKSDVAVHMLTHTGAKTHICSICGSAFRQKGQLTEHMKRHSAVKTHPCEICHKMFAFKGNLRHHLKSHSDEKAYVCEICGKQYKSRKGLKEHVNLHTGKTFSCKICYRTFWWSAGLYKHMIVAHGGEKNHQCPICGKQFSGKFYLTKHMIIHSDDKLHTCSSCGRGFKDKSALNRHVRMHTGEKRITCNICAKAFTRLENLRGHLLRFHKTN